MAIWLTSQRLGDNKVPEISGERTLNHKEDAVSHEHQYVHELFGRLIYVYLSVQSNSTIHGPRPRVTGPKHYCRRVGGIVFFQIPLFGAEQGQCLITVLTCYGERFHLYD